MLKATLTFQMSRLFMRHVARSPEGRAAILAQLANAEGGDGGELTLFEQLEAYTDDEKLKQLMRIHHDDELRHEQLFLARGEAQGVPLPEVPDRIKLLRRIDDAVGLFNRPVASDEDVVRLYMALLVIEERATAQFSLLAEAFAAAGDDETVAVLKEVEQDEARHLKYCHAITRRYQPDEEKRQALLEDMRQVEARCFAENGTEVMRWTLENGFIAGWRAGLWRRIHDLQAGREPAVITAYANMVAQGLA